MAQINISNTTIGGVSGTTPPGSLLQTNKSIAEVVYIYNGNNGIGAATIIGSSAEVNPILTANNYTAGYVMGGILTFPNILSNSNTGILESLTLKFKNTLQTGTFNIAIFNSSPSGTFTDHGAPSIANNDSAILQGIYSLSNYSNSLGTHTIYNSDGINKLIISNTGANLYVVVIATNGTSVNTTSNTDMSLKISTIW